MTGPVRVRRAVEADVEAAAPLFAAYRVFYGRPHDLAAAAEFLRERIGRGESVVLLGEVDGLGTVGFAQLYPTFESIALARLWVLNDLFVDPVARAHGVGTALLQEVEASARAAGVSSLALQTAHDNVAAQRLYERAGWVLDTTYRTYQKALPASR